MLEHGCLRTAALAATLAAALAAAPSAHAESATFVVTDAAPALAEADEGWTADLAIDNLTTEPLSFTAAVVGAEGCVATADPAEIPARTGGTVTVTLKGTCGAETSPPLFDLAGSGRAGGVGAQALRITPKRPPAASPNWNNLLAFPIAFAGAALLGIALLLRWSIRHRVPYAVLARGADPELSLGKVGGWARGVRLAAGGELPHLPAAFSLKDSWASNVTAIGAVLTGIFGSAEVVKAITDKGTESAIGLATVGAAIALALVTAAPVVMVAMKRRPRPEDVGHASIWAGLNRLRPKGKPKGDGVAGAPIGAKPVLTVYGVVCAAVLTLTGAAGELFVITQVGASLDLGKVGDVLVYLAGAIACLLLVVYAARAAWETLEDGQRTPESVKSELDKFLEALRTRGVAGPADLDQELRSFQAAQAVWPTSLGDEPRRTGTL